MPSCWQRNSIISYHLLWLPSPVDRMFQTLILLKDQLWWLVLLLVTPFAEGKEDCWEVAVVISGEPRGSLWLCHRAQYYDQVQGYPNQAHSLCSLSFSMTSTSVELHKLFTHRCREQWPCTSGLVIYTAHCCPLLCDKLILCRFPPWGHHHQQNSFSHLLPWCPSLATQLQQCFSYCNASSAKPTISRASESCL